MGFKRLKLLEVLEAREDAEDARDVERILKEEKAGKRTLYSAKEFEKRTGAKIT